MPSQMWSGPNQQDSSEFGNFVMEQFSDALKELNTIRQTVEADGDIEEKKVRCENPPLVRVSSAVLNVSS